MTEALLSAQKSSLQRITNFKIQVQKAQNFDKFVLETRLQILEDLWKGFTLRDTELVSSQETLKERSYFKNDVYITTEEAYVDAKSWILSKIASLTIPPLVLPEVKPHSPFKPKIPVPKFSGLQRDWESFKDRFTSLVIQDASIAPVFKLQLLVNNLEGEAGEKFKNTEVSAQNFQPVWDSLCRRYDNFHLREYSAVVAVADLPSATTETIQHLNLLLTTLTESLSTLRALKFDEITCASLLICLVETKLPKYPRSLWVDLVNTTHPNAATSLDTFQTFVERRLRNLDQLTTIHPSPKQITTSPASLPSSRVHVTTYHRKVHPGPRPCSICSEPHRLLHCATFLKWTPVKRRKWVRDHQVCSNCLGHSHLISNCPSQGRCFFCQQPHHTLLHLSSEETPPKSAVVAVSPPNVPSSVTNTHSSTLLSTAQVALESHEGNRVVVRALVDPCAEVCLISESVCKTLRLPRMSVRESISGSGGTVNTVVRYRTDLYLKSLDKTHFSLPISALVLNRVTQNVPHHDVQPHDWPHLKGLNLADPNFWKAEHIDCVLNSAVFGASILPEVKRASTLNDSPVAFNSHLGWILVGNTSSRPTYNPPSEKMYFQTKRKNSSLHHSMRKLSRLDSARLLG